MTTRTSNVTIRRLDRTLNGLQYLRALAAGMVLVFHVAHLTYVPLWSLLGTGVDLFFVLSGFLMMTITDASTRPGPFLWARIRRIVPLYWLVTTLSIILLWGGVSWVSPIPFRYIEQYRADVPLTLIAASYAFIPWFSEGAQAFYPVVPLGWTLNFEMLFYVLVPLSLFLARRWHFVALLVSITGLAVAGMGLGLHHHALAGWANPVMLEFLVGAWLGRVWQNRGDLWRAMIIAGLAVAAFAAAGTQFLAFDQADLRFVMSIPYGLLLVLVLHAEERSAVPSLTLPLFLGNASYAIYLVQFPVQLILEKTTIAPGLPLAVCIVCFTLLTAAILHRFIEVPMMRSRKPSSDKDADKARTVRA